MKRSAKSLNVVISNFNGYTYGKMDFEFDEIVSQQILQCQLRDSELLSYTKNIRGFWVLSLPSLS